MLYVGKAKNLQKRIQQYRQEKRLSTRKQQLVRVAKTVTYKVYTSELEALLAEAEDIRLYQPDYNILLKDDKSPLYILITSDRFPRVRTIRRQELVTSEVHGEIFGPYQSAYMAKQVLRAVRPAFRWCDQAGRDTHTAGRPCFYYHLRLCSGACVGGDTVRSYRARMRRLGKFLRGQSEDVQKQLQKQIRDAARDQRFEEAQTYKEELEAINHLLQPTYHLKPDLQLVLSSQRGTEAALKQLTNVLSPYLPTVAASKLRRVEAYDVSNFSGKYASVSMVVLTHGSPDPKNYRLFNIRRKDTPDDYAMMAEALERRQRHPEWGVPDLVVIDGGRGQVSAVKNVWNWPVPVIGLAKRPDRLVIPTEDGEYTFLPVDTLQDGGKLLQQARDEAHRFAKKQVHRRLKNRDIV